MRVLAEQGFPVFSFILFFSLSSSHPSFIFSVVFAISAFLLVTYPWGLLRRWCRYGHRLRRCSKERTDQAAMNPPVVAFGAQFGFFPHPGWVVSSALVLRVCLLILVVVRLRFHILHGADDDRYGRHY